MSFGWAGLEAFTAILKTLETLRGNGSGVLRSIRKIERISDVTETSWCIEDAPFTDLSELPAAQHLTSLYLVGCRKLKSFSGIAEHFPKLKTLWVYECDRLENLDGLQFLKQLEALTIWPSFSGKISVDSLEPLAGATTLNRLIFSGKCKDGSLAPLYELENLRSLFLSNNFAWDEFARFEAHQPDVTFPLKGGVVYDANPMALRCSSCSEPQAMLTGKGLQLCCPSCDAERLAKHIKRYTELSKATP